ncbi:MAG: MFS transporter, partial [Alphaproteobacteria bacterium]|nr:MFS transporter [Alphaproteobacteria bacterium]
IVYAASALLSAAASFVFALVADGFWWALVLRFVAGIGFAGVHIVGLKLLGDRLEGDAQARASAVYTGAFAIGSAGSFLMAGILMQAFDWPAVFWGAGIGSLLSLPLLLLIGPPLFETARARRWLPDFPAVRHNPEIMRYVAAYAGNIWEVFAIRVWFVPVLVFNAALHGDSVPDWNPATIAGMAVFIAVPLNLLIAELGIRFGRRSVVFAVSLSSVVVCLLLGWQASGPYWLVLALLLVHAVSSYGDAGAIAGGLMSASTPESRAAALTLFGIFGFTFGFLGSLAVGLTLDGFGGRENPAAWFWAFVVMAAGSVISAAAAAWTPKRGT